MGNKDKVINFLKLGIGWIILILLFYYIGIENAYKTLIGFNFFFLLPILLLFVAFLATSAFNLKILFDPLKKMTFSKMFKLFCFSWTTGFFVPGRLGDFSLVYFLKNEGIEVGKGTAIVLLNKLITFLMLSAAAIFSLLVFFEVGQIFNVVAFLLLGWLAVLFFVFSEFGRGIIKKFILGKYRVLFTGFSSTLQTYIKNYKHILLLNFCIAGLAWAIQTAITFLLFLGFSRQVDFMQLFLVIAATSLVSLIPLTASGIGIREGVFVFLTNRIGIPASVALNAAAINLVINLSAVFIISFLFLNK